MSYIAYPKLCVSADGYNENPERGSTLHRAEDGTPWIVNLWPETRYTFEITHPALSAEEQLALEQFYDQHIGDEVGWDNPRRQERWIVRMVGPPRLASMRDGMRGDVEMTLVGYRGVAPTYSVPPVVSGLHQIGQVLLVSQGTWQSEYPMQFEYQWLRNGEPIAGATDQNYTLVDDDLFNMISARVTATSLGGSTSVETDPVRARLDSAVSWLYSDMAETIFVDTSGNTPATWGYPVGLVKDSSGNGNDFTQPTVTARPILGRVPWGGRRNLFLSSQSFEEWSSTNASISENLFEAPDGTLTANRLVESTGAGVHQVTRVISGFIPATTYSMSVFAKAGERTKVALHWNHLSAQSRIEVDLLTGAVIFGSGDMSVEDAGGGWWRIGRSMSREEPSFVAITVLNDAGEYNYEGDGTSGLYLWAPQAELGAEITPYQKVTSDYDITESGVPEVHYLDFDGTDDLISTELPAISGGTLVLATDKGIWIDDDYNFDGGSFDIGPETYSGGPASLLGVIGNPLVGGALVIDRQLTTSERAQVVAYMKSIGSPGVIELGPELVVNGDFSEGLEGWITTAQATLEEGGVRLHRGDAGYALYIYQPAPEINPEQYMLVELDLVEATNTTGFAKGSSTGMAMTGVGFSISAGLQRLCATLSASGTHWGLTTGPNSNNLIRSISVRKLELVP